MGTLKRQREEPCYICGHYHNYEGGEQCKVCGHVLQALQVPAGHGSAMPTEVLPSFLYAGSYDHASRSELLKAIGITHILSVVPRCQRLYKNSFVYHTVTSSPADFQECFDFLDAVRSKQERVLVHCMTGMTRSCEIVVGYLIKLRRWSLSESYQWVKERHHACVLNQAELERLQLLEHHVLQGNSSLQAGNVFPGGYLAQGQSMGLSQAPFGQDLSLQQGVQFQPHAGPSICFGQPHRPSEQFVFGAQKPGQPI